MKQIILTLGFSFFSVAVSANMPIKVIDQYGEPVANAVISYQTNTSTAISSTDLQAPNQSPPQTIAVMDQIDRKFQPHVLVVEQGQQVSFPNSDNIRHHVYSFSNPKAFEIKLYKGRSTEPVLFDNTGVVVLGCNIHDNMVGYIYVRGDETALLTDLQGRVTLPDNPTEITVWHAGLSINNNLRKKISIDHHESTSPLVLTLELLAKPKQDKADSGFKSKRFGKKY
ncbi:methylamine utilization protein [Thalassotalea agariperforans]